MKGILGYTEEDAGSTDFIGDSRYGVMLLCYDLLQHLKHSLPSHLTDS